MSAPIGRCAAQNAIYVSKAAKSLATTTDAPNFVKQGTVQLTQAASGLASIYWPYVVNVEHIAGHLGNFYMYYSTDHDLGAGGVKMAYSDSPTGPWTKHPTFSYVDAVAGDQTETTSIIWNEDTNLFLMYYQQEGAGLNQSTFLATSPDGLTWTRIGGMVIQGITNVPGDGQTTYLRPFRAGGQWIGHHLFGGGNYGHGGISYSHDGITWVMDPRRLGFFNDLIGDTDQRIDLFHAVPFQWRGQTWALAQMGPHVGGFVVGGAKWVLGRISPDFRSFVGKPKQIFATLPAGETEHNGPTSVLAHGSKLYTYYRANGAQGDFRVAVAEA